MCGRLTLTATIDQIKQHFNIDRGYGAVLVPRYNIAPTQSLLVLRDNILEFFQWGVKLSRQNSNLIINAKLETILEKKLFSYSFKKRRCLVIGTGFFEWKNLNNKKIPYYCRIKKQNILGLGGIIIGDQCVILTTNAEEKNFQINFHHRFPVVIDKSKYSLWLNAKTPIDNLLSQEILVKQTSFIIEPVSSLVNNVSSDSIMCIKSLNDQL